MKTRRYVAPAVKELKQENALQVGNKTAAFHARVRGLVPSLGGSKETRNVSSPSKCESQYCGEPP